MTGSELAVEIDAAGAVGVPDPVDDVDCLVKCRNALLRGQPPSADRLYGIPEVAGSESEAGPSTGEQVQAGCRAGEDGGGLP
jgi:hypothetical protein